jgi:hypothetical protein
MYSKCLESRRQFGLLVGALVEERSRTIKQKMAALRADDPLRRIEFKELGLGDDILNNYLFALIKAQRGWFRSLSDSALAVPTSLTGGAHTDTSL